MLFFGHFVISYKIWVYTDKEEYEAADRAQNFLFMWAMGWCAVGLLCAMVFLHGC
jgi:hypothetical protein